MFNVGDVVRVKSRGPIMTVEQIPSEATQFKVVCIFYSSDCMKREFFLPHVLEKLTYDRNLMRFVSEDE